MDKSLFDGLPAEIRNAIYAHALFDPDGADIHSRPALLQTCKQIQDEASLMYWAINDFRIDIHEDKDNHGPCHWLRKAGPRLQLVRRLSIHIEIPSLRTASDAEATGGTCSTSFLLHIVVCYERWPYVARHYSRGTLSPWCKSQLTCAGFSTKSRLGPPTSRELREIYGEQCLRLRNLSRY